jgi:hypothetical protein
MSGLTLKVATYEPPTIVNATPGEIERAAKIKPYEAVEFCLADAKKDNTWCECVRGDDTISEGKMTGVIWVDKAPLFGSR